MKKIESPCEDSCKYDENNICIGCYRSKSEIVSWWKLTNEEKIKVLKKVEIRKQPGRLYKD